MAPRLLLLHAERNAAVVARRIWRCDVSRFRATLRTAPSALYGVGRGCGVGRGLGVTLGEGVADGVGVGVSVAVGLGVGVGVGVDVELSSQVSLKYTLSF